MLNPQDRSAGSGPTIAARQARRALRRYDEATVDVIVERYLAGDSTPKISADLGIPIRTVAYQLERRGIKRRPPSVPHKHPAPGERVCAFEGCDEKFTPTGYQVARGWGRFCSPACARAASRVAEPEERTCARNGCENRFTPMPSEAVRPGRGRFCSHRCRQLHLWRTGQVTSFVESLKKRGLWRSQAQKTWIPRWKAYCEVRRRETGTTSTYGKLAKLLAPDGKKVGAPFTTIDAAKAERILKLNDAGKSERAVARIVGASKTAVHNVVANRQGVIDHFSLHDLV
jgi:hypothetical protein